MRRTDLPAPPSPRRGKRYPLHPATQILLDPQGRPLLVERFPELDGPHKQRHAERNIKPWLGLKAPNLLPLRGLAYWHGQAFRYHDHTPSWPLHRLMSEVQRRGEGFPLAIASALISDVLQGAHAIHEARSPEGASLGLVHRNIAPNSVLVGHDGVTRLFDYRPLKRWEIEGSWEPRPTIPPENFHIVPPEQIRAEPLGPRSDVYASAALLWWLLAGRPPFQNRVPMRGVEAILQGEIEEPSRYREGLPVELEAVVLRGFRRYPEERYSSALEMAEELAFVCPPAPPEAVAAWARSLMEDRSVAPGAGDDEVTEDAWSHPYRSATTATKPAPEDPEDTEDLPAQRDALMLGPTGVLVAVGLGLLAASALLNTCGPPVRLRPAAIMQPRP